MSLSFLDLEALRATPLTREPFQYLVVPGFVRPAARNKINRDCPEIAETGSFPVGQLAFGPQFREFVDQDRRIAMLRHHVSASFKRLFGAGSPNRAHG